MKLSAPVLRCAAITVVLALTSGCATRPESLTPIDSGQSWSGRMTLQAVTEPPTKFSANFELHGTPDQGQLTLTTPLGTTLAVAQWQPGLAELHSANAIQRFPNLKALTENLSGIALPVDSLFAWLEGRPALADGWEADLSQLPQQRLTASRKFPPPLAEIKVLIDSTSNPHQ